MNCKFAKIFLIFLTLLSFVTAAAAYNVQFADDSKKIPLRWQDKKIPVAFSKSFLNQNSVSEDEIQRAIKGSLAAWENVADIQFIQTWTDDNSVSPLGKNGDGVNLITISQVSDNLLLFSGDASDNAGRTRVFFNREGNITEADIVLNPYARFSTDGSFGTYDLESVLTHEIGHLLGLEHSDILAATMFAEQGKNGVYNLQSFSPRTLSADDISGIRSIYGAKSEEIDCCGSINGKISVLAKTLSKKFKVFAEDLTTGRFVAEVMTDEDGNFVFEGLTTGSYVLYSTSAELSNTAYEEIGTAEISANKRGTINKKIKFRQKNFDIQFVGFNGQIANLPIPLNAGKNYVVYAAGKNLNTDKLNVSVNSPFIKVNPKSFTSHDYGAELSVISFEITLSPDVPKGDYSISMIDKNGNTDTLFGCLSVEEMKNPWFSFIF